MLEGQYLSPDDALGCRSVCKTWKGAVDAHYNTANMYSITFKGGNGYQYPRAAITVPIDEEMSEKLTIFASHGSNPFLGGRLMVRIGGAEGRILDQVQAQAVVASETVQHVWDHVEHLEILERDDLVGGDDDWFMGMDGLIDVLCPILERMKNVKTVVFKAESVGAEVLRFMPGLKNLEQFVVLVEWDYDITDYNPILNICNGSLKLLRSKGYLAECMDGIAQRLEFPRMTELWLAGPTEKLFQNRVRIAKSLSNLRNLGVEFQYSVGFFTQLVDVSFALTNLEQIEINCERDSLSQMPLMYFSQVRCAREGLKKVSIVETSKFAKDEFNVIVKNVKKVFPAVGHLEIVRLKKSRNVQDVSCNVA